MTRITMTKLNYLTEEEAKMDLDLALMQIALGLNLCNTVEEAMDILQDAVELGRREANRSVPSRG